MGNYNQKDLAFYSKDQKRQGDLDIETKIGVNGEELRDLRITDDYESARQDATNRIRTQQTDWGIYDSIGANLEIFIGMPNTKATGESIQKAIVNALTYDGRFDESDVDSRSVPTSPYRIDNFTLIDTNDDEEIIITTPIEV